MRNGRLIASRLRVVLFSFRSLPYECLTLLARLHGISAGGGGLRCGDGVAHRGVLIKVASRALCATQNKYDRYKYRVTHLRLLLVNALSIV